MSKILSAALFSMLLLISFGLSTFALGATYWAAGMYFGWTLVLSVTAMFLLVQGLVLINLYRGERDDH